MQEDVFQAIGVPAVDNVLQGYNCSILAYGQTGSGKTYTMMGSAADWGLIPRVCNRVFEELSNRVDVTATVEASFLEIYKENVRDLFQPPAKTREVLRVREHAVSGAYVEGLRLVPVQNYKQVQMLLVNGSKQRITAATDMNASSSRSHAIFTLHIVMKKAVSFSSDDSRDSYSSNSSEGKEDDDRDRDGDDGIQIMAKASLVDLAGSECAKMTGCTG